MFSDDEILNFKAIMENSSEVGPEFVDESPAELHGTSNGSKVCQSNYSKRTS